MVWKEGYDGYGYGYDRYIRYDIRYIKIYVI